MTRLPSELQGLEFPQQRPAWLPADGSRKPGALLGFYIFSLRKQCHLTQETVANDLYISQSYLRKIEHGEANPSVNMTAKILNYLEACARGEQPPEIDE